MNENQAIVLVLSVLIFIVAGIVPGVLLFLLVQGAVLSSFRVPATYIVPIYLIAFPLVKGLMTAGLIKLSASGKKIHAEPSGWSVLATFAGSAFAYPLLAGISVGIFSILEKLLGVGLYSANDKSLLLFAVLAYMTIAVCMDASYIGRVRYGSVRKGIVRFMPRMIAVGVAVFVMAILVLQAGIMG